MGKSLLRISKSNIAFSMLVSKEDIYGISSGLFKKSWKIIYVFDFFEKKLKLC
jgi:hypothetical protein